MSTDAIHLKILNVFEGCKPSEISEIKLSSCSASSEHNSNYLCEKAFDGNLGDGWATLNQGVGAWIMINFESLYRLTKISVKQRPSDEYFKDISIDFKDGTPVDFTLPHTHPSNDWEDIELTDHADIITTDYLNISANSVYRESNNGFSEVKVFGCAPGTIMHLIL